MTSENPSLSVHIKLTINPDKIQEFLEILRPMLKHVAAEDRNIFIEVYQDEQRPGVFKIVENWNADLEHMYNVQIKKEYYKPYHAALKELLLMPHEHEIYSRMPGNEWASVRKDSYPDGAK